MLVLWVFGASYACAASSEIEAAISRITAQRMMEHIRVLSSDEFQGRAPGTPGEERTIKYLVDQFQQLGLVPGNPVDGSYIQPVPLVGFTATKAAMSFTARGRQIDFHFPNDAVIWSRRFEPNVSLADNDVVFVGYGVVAPEYDWDDFKGVDVRGKTVLMLVNDPPVPDPADPSRLDPKTFKGETMTYYGRWTYKFESAAAHGAKAAIIVHQTGPAGYPWGVIMISSGRENFDLRGENAAHADIEGWITVDNARKLCAAAGKDFNALKQAAVRRDFRPVDLGVKANFAVESTLRDVASRNVIAKIDGSDPKLKDEYVIYTAHWDHLGRDAKASGDQIYHGALDNASGCAALIELARAFTAVKPKRTVIFLAVTAEEKGLLGARFYAAHPLYPLDRTLANLNTDGVSVWGRTRDVGVVGYGQSTLEDLLVPAAESQGRTVRPESEPGKGYYFRSDHFEFAKVGVPALYLDKGVDVIGKPAGYGMARRKEYIDRDYHQVSDVIKPEWDLGGAVEDAALMFEVGYAVAQGDQRPQWKEGSEFKSARERMKQ
jgi:Zn-dependent M28 family amino/carboxypeptidase